MKSSRSHLGFTLAEVVLAIAIMATGVTAILGLLPSLMRLSGDSADVQTALRLSGAVKLELQRRAAGDFHGFARSLPANTSDPEQGLHLVAARDGSDLRWLDPGEAPVRDQYFLVVVRGFVNAPLAYDEAIGVCAANVLIAWPYRIPSPTGLTTAPLPSDRQTVSFNISIGR